MFKSSAKYLRKNIINYVFIDCRTHPPNFWMWMFFQWSLNCEQKGIREQAIVSSFGIQKQAMSPFTKPRQKKNSFSLTAFIIYSPLYFLPPLFSSFVKKSILLFFVIWAPLLYEPFFCQSVSQLHLCVSVFTLCVSVSPPLLFCVPPCAFWCPITEPVLSFFKCVWPPSLVFGQCL